MTVSVFLDADEISGETVEVSFRRGKSLETDTTDAGVATVVVLNQFANFNPDFLIDSSSLLMESDDFLLLENGDRILLESGNGTSGANEYGSVVVGRELTIYDGAVLIYTGFVADYNYAFERANRSRATIDAVDALSTLGGTYISEWQTPTYQWTGDRLTSLLDRSDVAFPSGGSARSIASGTQPVQTDLVPAGRNALQYAQDLANTERGRLFITRAGRLDFTDRYDAFNTTPTVTFTDELYEPGVNLPIAGIGVRFGTEAFYFSVTAERLGGEPWTVTNAAVQAQYPKLGARNFNHTGLLSNSEEHAYGNAEFLAGRLSNSRAVISGLRIPLPRLSVADRATVCALDIGDVVAVEWTPPNTNGAVTQTLVIEGVDYSADAHDDAVLEFQLSDATDPGYFEWDISSWDGPDPIAP